MAGEAVRCPNCGQSIEVAEVISRQLEERIRSQFALEANRKEQKYQETLAARERDHEAKIEEERKKATQKAREAARESLVVELSDLKAQLEDKAGKLEAARREELSLRKRQRELEEREAVLQLETARMLDSERVKIRDEILLRVGDEHRMKEAEKDKQLTDMRRQIDELKRKAEQGSQQLQGEVMELEIEALLRREFPFDAIEPVAKGARGGDVLQKVHTQSGKLCGVILWEVKRTKAWSDGWIQKLKDDQREAKADLAVIVTETLPKGLTRFRQIESVWVTEFPSMTGLALALRMSLIQVSKAREALVGKSEKMELVYNYLTGPEFRSRIEAVMEAFRSLQADLNAEKTAMEKIWAKREKQITKVLVNMSGMYGDMEGLSGTVFPEIKSLELFPAATD